MSASLSKNYLVGIRCYTYNHAQYITDALNGFTMQQTTFPFIAMVVDDASTDGEQEVIATYLEEHFDTKNGDVAYNKETDYAHISFAQHKLNKNCYIVVLYLKENLYSKKQNYKKREYLSEWIENIKYEALCEGDDYWTDPLKLQKQVDFLEANPEYGMCYTNFDILVQKTCEITKSLFTTQPDKYPIKYNSPEEFVYKQGYVCPPSWLVRRECLIPPNEQIKSLDGTFVMFTHYLCTTKVHGMLDVTATYRELPESASHSNDYSKMAQRELNLLHTQWALIDKYNLRQSLKAECEVLYYKQRLVQFILHNDKVQIAQARTIIKDRSIRDRILFALDQMPFGSYLLRFVYKSRSLLKSFV